MGFVSVKAFNDLVDFWHIFANIAYESYEEMDGEFHQLNITYEMLVKVVTHIKSFVNSIYQ